MYGSDAVAGVTNFILDHDFTGIKADLSGGETTYGDGRNGKTVAGRWLQIAGDKGHVLLSGEITNQDGVTGAAATGTRRRMSTSRTLLTSPATAPPQYITE